MVGKIIVNGTSGIPFGSLPNIVLHHRGLGGVGGCLFKQEAANLPSIIARLIKSVGHRIGFLAIFIVSDIICLKSASYMS